MSEKVLFVNACMRNDGVSRTHEICRELLGSLNTEGDVVFQEIILKDLVLEIFDEVKLAQREKLLKDKQFTHAMFDYANQFANADLIIIGAPYWDLSFPALLKIYFENIFVSDITFQYTLSGPEGLCKAKAMVYITTAGGYIGQRDFGTEYVKGVAEFFGIPAFYSLCGEGLDLPEVDEQTQLKPVRNAIVKLAEELKKLLNSDNGPGKA